MRILRSYEPGEVLAGRYRLVETIGKGGFAKVYLCTAMDTGKNYAVKIVPKANLVKARARQKVSSALFVCMSRWLIAEPK